jgi:hypothetical protein
MYETQIGSLRISLALVGSKFFSWTGFGPLKKGSPNLCDPRKEPLKIRQLRKTTMQQPEKIS